MGGSWSARGKFQQLGCSPWEVWNLNPRLRSPAYSTRVRKEPRQGFCLPERDGWRCREPPRGPTHKIFICRYLPWAPAKGGKSGLKMLEESLGMVTLGWKLREQPLGSQCWVNPHTAGIILLRQKSFLQVKSAWREAIAPPTRITSPTDWLE